MSKLIKTINFLNINNYLSKINNTKSTNNKLLFKIIKSFYSKSKITKLTFLDAFNFANTIFYKKMFKLNLMIRTKKKLFFFDKQ